LSRIVQERHGSKAARTALQGAILSTAYYTLGIDYLNNWLFGPAGGVTNVPPELKAAGDVFTFLINVGNQRWDSVGKDIQALERDALAFIPGRLLYKDIQAANEKGLQELFIYTRKDKTRRKSTPASERAQDRSSDRTRNSSTGRETRR
jgi:hypothetical protein